MKRKTAVIILLTALCFVFSACGSEESTVSADGSMLMLSMEDIETQELSGFFVMNQNGTFSPVMNRAEGYGGLPEGSAAKSSLYSRFLWFHDNDLEISSLIPVVKDGGELVFIYDNDEDFPASFILEKYDYKGYTLGCHVYRGEDNSLYLSTEEMLFGSSAADALSGLEGDYYKISAINGDTNLPVKNIDNNMMMILGLEKGKYYDFEFFKGTKYISFQTLADTLAFQCSSAAELKNPYTRTKDGYFIINLPDNLQNGYYYICGMGMFKYES